MNNEEDKLTFYCTKQGLKRFANKGEIDGMLENVYHLTQEKERIRILELLLKSIEKGEQEIFILEDQNFKVPKGLMVHASSEFEVLFNYQFKNVKFRFELNERNLSKIIYECLGHLPKNPKIKSVEFSKAYLKQLIDEVSRRT